MKAMPIESLVPHARPMLLLDRMTDMDGESFEAELSLTKDSEFCVDGKVGAWVGIEYMAQCVAAFAGAEGLAAGENIKVGFLLGTRQYQCAVPHFKAGSILRIRVKKVLHDPQGLSVVECALRLKDGPELARANLTVFQVDDFEAYLRNSQK
jgi:predicted hotdog family 3-hydroxylacyl-ACP dehydratase